MTIKQVVAVAEGHEYTVECRTEGCGREFTFLAPASTPQPFSEPRCPKCKKPYDLVAEGERQHEEARRKSKSPGS